MNQISLSLLSEKEKDVFALWIHGQTAKQSAGYLGKSNRTVESHREKIKCKLGIDCVGELHKKVLRCPEYTDIFRHGMTLILGPNSF